MQRGRTLSGAQAPKAVLEEAMEENLRSVLDGYDRRKPVLEMLRKLREGPDFMYIPSAEDEGKDNPTPPAQLVSKKWSSIPQLTAQECLDIINDRHAGNPDDVAKAFLKVYLDNHLAPYLFERACYAKSAAAPAAAAAAVAAAPGGGGAFAGFGAAPPTRAGGEVVKKDDVNATVLCELLGLNREHKDSISHAKESVAHAKEILQHFDRAVVVPARLDYYARDSQRHTHTRDTLKLKWSTAKPIALHCPSKDNNASSDVNHDRSALDANIKQVCEFYYTEREKCWELLQELVRVTGDNKHPFHREATSFIDKLSPLSEKLVGQLVECVTGSGSSRNLGADLMHNIKIKEYQRHQPSDDLLRHLADLWRGQGESELCFALDTLTLLLYVSAHGPDERLGCAWATSPAALVKRILEVNLPKIDEPFSWPGGGRGSQSDLSGVKFRYLALLCALFFSPMQGVSPGSFHALFKDSHWKDLEELDRTIVEGGKQADWKGMWSLVYILWNVFLEFYKNMSDAESQSDRLPYLVNFKDYPAVNASNDGRYINQRDWLLRVGVANPDPSKRPLKFGGENWRKRLCGVDAAPSPLNNYPSESAILLGLELFEYLLQQGLDARHAGVDLERHQRIFQSAVDIFIFHFTSPASGGKYAKLLVSLIEKCYSHPLDEQFTGKFWPEWDAQISLVSPSNPPVPVGGAVRVEYHQYTPLAVFTQQLSVSSLDDSELFFRLLTVLCDGNDYGFCRVVSLLNESHQLTSKHLEDELVMVTLPNGEEKCCLRPGLTGRGGEFGSLRDGLCASLTPEYGDVFIVSPIDPNVIDSLFQEGMDMYTPFSATPPEKDKLKESQMGPILKNRLDGYDDEPNFHLTRRMFGFVEEAVQRSGKGQDNARPIYHEINRRELVIFADDLVGGSQVMGPAGPVQQYNWPLFGQSVVAGKDFTAIFSDPSIKFVDKAQLALRRLLKLSLVVKWDLEVSWWVLLLDALIEAPSRGGGRSGLRAALKRQIAAQNLLVRLMQVDGISTRLELCKVWDDVQMTTFLEKFFATQPPFGAGVVGLGVASNMLKDLFKHLRTNILPSPYQANVWQRHLLDTSGNVVQDHDGSELLQPWYPRRCEGATVDSLLATGQKIMALVIKRIKEQHVQQHGLGPGGESKINDDDCKRLIFAPAPGSELPLDVNDRQTTSNGVPNSWCEAAEWASPDVWAELDAFNSIFNSAPQSANSTLDPSQQRRAWWIQPMALCRFAVALSLSFPNVGKRSACCEAIVSVLAESMAFLIPTLDRSTAAPHSYSADVDAIYQQAVTSTLAVLSKFAGCPSPWFETVTAELSERFGMDPSGLATATQPSAGATATGFASQVLQISLKYEVGLSSSSNAGHSHAITAQACHLFQAHLSALERGAHSLELRKLFDDVDVDGSGTLTRSEVEKCLKDRGYEWVTRRAVDALFRAIEDPATCAISYSDLFRYAVTPASEDSYSDGQMADGGTDSLTELRRLLLHMTSDGGGRLGPHVATGFALSAVEYCCYVFSTFSSWEFEDRCLRWEIASTCMDVFRLSLGRAAQTNAGAGSFGPGQGAPLPQTSTADRVAHLLIQKASSDGGQLVRTILQCASLLGLSAMRSSQSDVASKLPISWSGGIASVCPVHELKALLLLTTNAIRTLSTLLEASASQPAVLQNLLVLICKDLATVPHGLLHLPRGMTPRDRQMRGTFGHSLDCPYLTVIAGLLDLTELDSIVCSDELRCQVADAQLETLRLISKLIFIDAKVGVRDAHLLDLVGGDNIEPLAQSLTDIFQTFKDVCLGAGAASRDDPLYASWYDRQEALVVTALDLLLTLGMVQPVMLANLLAVGEMSSANQVATILQLTRDPHPEKSSVLTVLLQTLQKGSSGTNQLYAQYPLVMAKVLCVVRLILDNAANPFLASAALYIARFQSPKNAAPAGAGVTGVGVTFWDIVTYPLLDNVDLYGEINYRRSQEKAESPEEDFQEAWREWKEEKYPLLYPADCALQMDGNMLERRAADGKMFDVLCASDFLRSARVSRLRRKVQAGVDERAKVIARECHVLLVHAAALDLLSREVRGVFRDCLNVLLREAGVSSRGESPDSVLGMEKGIESLRRLAKVLRKDLELPPANLKKPSAKNNGPTDEFTKVLKENEDAVRKEFDKCVAKLIEIPRDIEADVKKFNLRAKDTRPPFLSRCLKSYIGSSLVRLTVDASDSSRPRHVTSDERVRTDLDDELLRQVAKKAVERGVNLDALTATGAIPTCDPRYGADHQYHTRSLAAACGIAFDNLVSSGDVWLPSGGSAETREVIGVLRKPRQMLETEFSKYFAWIDLSHKVAQVNNMWSVGDAKAVLLRSARRYLTVFVPAQYLPQQRLLNKKNAAALTRTSSLAVPGGGGLPRNNTGAGGAGGAGVGSAGDDDYLDHHFDSPSAESNLGLYSPQVRGLSMGEAPPTPSGQSIAPTAYPGDVRSFSVLKELLDDLQVQALAQESGGGSVGAAGAGAGGEPLSPSRRASRRDGGFDSGAGTGAGAGAAGLSSADWRNADRGHDALLCVERYDLLLTMLSHQLQVIEERTADPEDAVVIDRDLGSSRLSMTRASEFLSQLSFIYQAQVRVLEKSECWGSRLADVSRRVQLPLLASMLLLLSRLQEVESRLDGEGMTLEGGDASIGGGGRSANSATEQDSKRVRLAVFLQALAVIRHEARQGGALAFLGVGGSGSHNSRHSPQSSLVFSSWSSDGSHGGLRERERSSLVDQELPLTFSRCVDVLGLGGALRLGSQLPRLVKTCLRLLKSTLPKADSVLSAEAERWGPALSSSQGQPGECLLPALSDLLGSREAVEFIAKDQNYARWRDCSRVGYPRWQFARRARVGEAEGEGEGGEYGDGSVGMYLAGGGGGRRDDERERDWQSARDREMDAERDPRDLAEIAEDCAEIPSSLGAGGGAEGAGVGVGVGVGFKRFAEAAADDRGRAPGLGVGPSAIGAATSTGSDNTPAPVLEPADVTVALQALLDVMLGGLEAGPTISRALAPPVLLLRALSRAPVLRALQDTLLQQVALSTAQAAAERGSRGSMPPTTGGTARNAQKQARERALALEHSQAKVALLMGYSAETGEPSVALECWDRVIHIATAVARLLAVLRESGAQSPAPGARTASSTGGGYFSSAGGSGAAADADEVQTELLRFAAQYEPLLLLSVTVARESRFSLRQLEIFRTTM